MSLAHLRHRLAQAATYLRRKAIIEQLLEGEIDMPKRLTKIDRGVLQRLLDNEETERRQSEIDVVTPELRAKGHCTAENGVHINRGGTPVMRWLSAGKLSETQALAIMVCYRLWDLVGIRPSRQTSRYAALIARGTVSGLDDDYWRTLTTIEAKADLARIEGYFSGLGSYWLIFENVCRWDEPAGVAGSRLGFSSRSSEDRAHQVVCMVADIIATREGLRPVSRIRVA